MKALITGASGFIGRHLVDRLLQEGHTVRAVIHECAPPDGFAGKVEVFTGDVRDAGAMKAAAAGAEVVFHLAGKTHALSEIGEDEAGYRSLNVEGTRTVLEASVAGGAQQFIFFSSVKAMGDEAPECRDESCETKPVTAYGRSKLAAEQLVFEHGSRTGLSAVCLRLPLVYGSGNKGNLFRMIAAIDRGIFPPWPPVNNRRSLVHVANVVQAALLAAASPAAGGRCYIVTDAQPYSTRALYELICRALGKDVPSWSVPAWLLAALGRAGDVIGRLRGRRVPFDSFALAKLTGSAWYSSDRIARELGYRPLMSLEAALPDMIAWYRSAAA
jgi:nucleoside-diphosphate-sugar epimerase